MDSLLAWLRRRSSHPITETASLVLGIGSPEAPPRALIVEEDAPARRLCRDTLERAGFVVDDVESGIAAVLSARETSPNLVLVGLQLRDVPGREAVEWLCSNPTRAATPLVVFIGNFGDETEWAGATGAAILRKPLSAAAVIRAIEQVIAQRYSADPKQQLPTELRAGGAA